MAANVHSREHEQRERKRAELQSLHSNLANLREREGRYIKPNAAIPEILINQINELRQAIASVENELLALNDETIQLPARQFYQEAFEAELAYDFDQALKLYKKASYRAHPDAAMAMRSLRYRIKTAKSKAVVGQVWTPLPANRSRNRLLIGLAILLILALLVAFAINGFLALQPEEPLVVEPTRILTSTPPAVILIVPDTATPIPSQTPTDTPAPTPIQAPSPTPIVALTPTPSPTLTPTLRPAPKIIGPKDGLVWGDGAIVFEFERLDLAHDELYCLNTLKGFDQTNTENWSFPAVGSKEPEIPIEAHVFRIAKVQDMRCIVWSAAIGKGSCDNIISNNTEERVIGLPQPCQFNRK